MVRSVGATDRKERLSPDILRWAQAADEEFVACRDLGHAWPGSHKDRLWGEENHQFRKVWTRQFVCTRGCGVYKVERRDFVTRERTVTYYYPKAEGETRSPYRLPPGCSRLTRDLVFDLDQVMAGASSTPAKLKPVKVARSTRQPAAAVKRAKTTKVDGGSRQRARKAS